MNEVPTTLFVSHGLKDVSAPREVLECLTHQSSLAIYIFLLRTEANLKWAPRSFEKEIMSFYHDMGRDRFRAGWKILGEMNISWITQVRLKGKFASGGAEQKGTVIHFSKLPLTDDERAEIDAQTIRKVTVGQESDLRWRPGLEKALQASKNHALFDVDPTVGQESDLRQTAVRQESVERGEDAGSTAGQKPVERSNENDSTAGQESDSRPVGQESDSRSEANENADSTVGQVSVSQISDDYIYKDIYKYIDSSIRGRRDPARQYEMKPDWEPDDVLLNSITDSYREYPSDYVYRQLKRFLIFWLDAERGRPVLSHQKWTEMFEKHVRNNWKKAQKSGVGKKPIHEQCNHATEADMLRAQDEAADRKLAVIWVSELKRRQERGDKDLPELPTHLAKFIDPGTMELRA